jgi:restriction endonuclease S subunit
MSGAVGHRRVSKDWIDNYLMPFPKSLNDQQSIVNQLEALSTETQQLEENYRKKLESLEELKKSILQKAFSGELTRQTTEIQMEQLDMVAENQAKYQTNP